MERDGNLQSVSHQMQSNADHMQWAAAVAENPAFVRAARHSKWVRFLKILLPSAGLTFLVIFIAVVTFRPSLLSGVDFAELSILDGEIVMRAPNLRGFTADNKAYDVKADRALQKLDDATQIRLEILTANVEMKDDDQAKITADNGFFDTGAEFLRLSGNIKLSTRGGYLAELEEADINLADGNMKSTKPVKIIKGDSFITADEMELLENGERMLFEGRVKVLIKRNSKKADSVTQGTNE